MFHAHKFGYISFNQVNILKGNKYPNNLNTTAIIYQICKFSSNLTGKLYDKYVPDKQKSI